MGQSIEFQKQFSETVYVNLPGPREPEAGMSGGELLHGFLAELYEPPSPEMKAFVTGLCSRWNVVYREKHD